MTNGYFSIFNYMGNEISDIERRTQINIQVLLTEKGINQKDLAEGIGIPAGSLNDMLSPKGKMRLKLHTIEKIAAFLGVPITAIITGKAGQSDSLPPELQEINEYYMNIPTFKKGIDWFLVDIYAKCKREIEEYKKGASGGNSPSK